MSFFIMNITDIQDVEVPTFSKILELQKALLAEYQKFDEVCRPFDIDSYEGQQQCRTLLFRAVEEYSEFREAETLVHKEEELADCIIFLLELSILLDLPINFEGERQTAGLDIIPVLYPLKYLRNKPWKKTQVRVDVLNFRLELTQEIETFFFKVQNNFPGIIQTIWKKQKVNFFRISTNY